jgi:signal transduction histidine kinase
VKIKSQSYILIAGIVVMPLLVISVFFVYERLNLAYREARRYEELRLDSLTTDAELRVWAIIREKPKDLDMAVADPTGRVIYSTITEIRTGSNFIASLAAASHGSFKGKTFVFGYMPPLPEGYSAVASVPLSELLPSNAFGDFILVCILALAAILLFTAAMSVLIVSSITRSVLSLEEATRRVAAGELDLPIAIDGSNEIASLSRSLDRMRLEIKEDQARRARFIMGISHDLKTPLALVKGYAEALEEELGGAESGASAHLGIIQDKADQLEGMIDDLIDFERVDTGEWSRGLAELDFASFLRAFSKRVEADAALLGRELRSRVELREPILVCMDERLVSRALENLVYNALRYTAAGGIIELCASAKGEFLVVTIRDDGPGISAMDLPHIFEPFYRGSSSRREQGMGLGLSIVKTVVESHGWTIEVPPGKGKGVSFVIVIPCPPTDASKKSDRVQR